LVIHAGKATGRSQVPPFTQPERAGGNAKRQVGPREDAETSTIAEESATLRKAG